MELRKDVQPEVLLNQLYRLSPLQSNFAVNNVVLIHGAPKQAGIIEILKEYIMFQEEVITRRTQFDLDKASARAHILEGLRIAVDNLDAIIHTIRDSKDANEAMPRLMNGFGLDEIQAKAILDMQFRRLTGLEREKIENEYQELLIKIADYQDILAHHERIEKILKDELTEIKGKYADPRRSEIINAPTDMEDEDLIPVEDVIITISENGYIKRQTRDTYKVQNRGGKGIKGMGLNEDDLIDQFVGMSTHDNILFFTSKGRVYRLKGYNIPEYSRTSKGIPVINLLQLESDEKIQAIIQVKGFGDDQYLFMATRKGIVKKTAVSEFANIRKVGLIALSLDDDDVLIGVKPTDGESSLMLGTKSGMAIAFSEEDVRAMGRSARGVKGISLREGDEVVGMDLLRRNAEVLTVTEEGFGKRTSVEEYRTQSRGGKGIINLKVTEKTGPVVGIKVVNEDQELMLITAGGIVIRMNVADISVYGRSSQGVKLMSTGEEDQVVALATVEQKNE